MDNTNVIKQHFLEAQEILTQFLNDEQQMDNINDAANLMITSLKNGGKIISCGNGGSHCDAMHFAEELTGRYRNNRPGIAAIAISDPSHISCVGNDYGYDFIFSRYVEALGKPGDVLLGISTSGNSKNIVNAMESAKLIGMTTIGLTGKDGGVIKDLCDIEIRAPYSNFADRAQEIHIKVIHSLIDSIEIGMGYR
jgi:D-sedoheptulose 7-phosphate isomerase